MPPAMDQSKNNRLTELALVFLKLGTVAFGGPAAHVAMMDEQIVRQRGWLGMARPDCCRHMFHSAGSDDCDRDRMGLC